MIALFSGKAITFLHNPGLECSRTLQRAVGILQRAQDDYYSITPMPFPCLNSPNRDGFCCPFGVFVARSAFQVKRAYVTMPHASVKLLWIYCMQTCLFLLSITFTCTCSTKYYCSLKASSRSGAVHFCKKALLSCIEKSTSAPQKHLKQKLTIQSSNDPLKKG